MGRVACLSSLPGKSFPPGFRQWDHGAGETSARVASGSTSVGSLSWTDINTTVRDLLLRSDPNGRIVISDLTESTCSHYYFEQILFLFSKLRVFFSIWCVCAEECLLFPLLHFLLYSIHCVFVRQFLLLFLFLVILRERGKYLPSKSR